MTRNLVGKICFPRIIFLSSSHPNFLGFSESDTDIKTRPNNAAVTEERPAVVVALSACRTRVESTCQDVCSTAVIESQKDVRRVNSRHIDSSAVTGTHGGGLSRGSISERKYKAQPSLRERGFLSQQQRPDDVPTFYYCQFSSGFKEQETPENRKTSHARDDRAAV